MATATSALPKPRRRWAWVVAAVMLWLVIGAVVNVGVAWWQAALFQCIVHEEAMRSMGTELGDDKLDPLAAMHSRRWPIHVPKEWPSNPSAVRKDDFWACTTISASARVGPRGSELHCVALYQHGWPLRSVSDWMQATSPWSQQNAVIDGGYYPVPNNKWWPGVYKIPIRPLLPGFALNTLFYAALAWGVWQVPWSIRRWRRRANGMCVECGYDLKGLAAGAACPECGGATDKGSTGGKDRGTAAP